MAFSIRIDTSQAARAATAFQRILDSIRASARALDAIEFAKLGNSIKRITNDIDAMHRSIQSVVTLLGTLQYTFNSVASNNFAAKLSTGISGLRDMIRGLNKDVSDLKRSFDDAAKSATAAGSSSSGRARRRASATAETAAAADTASSVSKALTVVDTSAIVASIANVSKTVDGTTISLSRVSRELVVFSSATKGASDHAGEFSRRVDAIFTSMSRVRGLLSSSTREVRGFLPPATNAVATRPSSAVTPFVHEGVFAGTSEGTSASVRKFSGAIVDAKVKKDALDKNMKDMSSTTFPQFAGALRFIVGYLAIFTVGRIIGELRELGKELFETGKQVESVEAQFRASTNSADQASRLFLIARDRARELGLETLHTATEFAKLNAAARGSSLEGAKVEQIFRGLTAAEAVFIKTTGEAGRLTKVFTDILGKGRLQSEELVKQLGNIVPGSIRVVAQSLGKTTTELNRDIARGTLQVETVLVRLAAELERRYGTEAAKNIERLGGAFTNVKNSITELQILVVKGGFSEFLINSFKQIQAFLEDDRTRAAVLALAQVIQQVLGTALRFIIGLFEFLRDKLQFIIPLFTALAAAITGIGLLAFLKSLAVVLGALGLLSGPGGLIALLIGLNAVGLGFIAGVAGATEYSDSLDAASKKTQQLREEEERLRKLQADDNNNPADQTRALADALERVDKELRVFLQDQETQIDLLALSEAGVSTLSSRYDSLSRALERVRALEKTDTFTKLGPGSKEAVTQALAQTEFNASALRSLGELRKELDRTLESRRALVESFRDAQAVSDNPRLIGSSTDIQQEFNERIIPVMLRVQEIIKELDNTDLSDSVVRTFNNWSRALRENVLALKQVQIEFRALNSTAEAFKDLELDEAISQVTRGLRNSQRVVVPSGNTVLTDRVGGLLPPDLLQLQEKVIQERAGAQPRSLAEAFRTANEQQRDLLKPFIEALEKQNQRLTEAGELGGKAYTQGFQDAVRKDAPQARQTISDYARDGEYRYNPAGAPYANIIRDQAARKNIDPDLIFRILQAESGFNPRAVGSSGEKGIAQFTADTARAYNLRDPFDPADSIRAAVDLMSDLLMKFKGDVASAVSAYNAGPAGNFNNPTTTRYRANVLTGYAGNGYGQNIQQGIAGVQRFVIDIEKDAPNLEQIDQTVKSIERSTADYKATIEQVSDAIVDLTLKTLKIKDEQVFSSEQAEAERLLDVLKEAQRVRREFPVQQSDIDNRTPAFQAFQTNLANRVAIQSRRFTLERTNQAQQTILALQREAEATERQIKLLERDAFARDADGAAEERRIAFIARGLVYTKEQREAFEAANKALREQELAFKRANGPLRQYIDSLGDAQEATERFAVSVVTGIKSAFADSVVGLFDRLEQRGQGVRDAQTQLAEARARLREVPITDPEGRISASRDISQAESALATARANQPSVLSTIFEPFKELGKSLFADALSSVVDQITKPLLEDLNKFLGVQPKASPEIEATKQQTMTLVEAIVKGSDQIVSAVQNSARLGGAVSSPEEAANRLAQLRSQFPEGISTSDALDTLSTTTYDTTDSLDSLSSKGSRLSGTFDDAAVSVSNFTTSLTQIIGAIRSGDASSLTGALLNAGLSVVNAYSGGTGQANFDANQGAFTAPSIQSSGTIQTGAVGGIIGADVMSTYRGSLAILPNNVSRFETGGIVGTDSVPALLTPGEGVFTREQMRNLSPASSTGDTYETTLNVYNPSDADSFKRSEQQLLDIAFRRMGRESKRRGQRV